MIRVITTLYPLNPPYDGDESDPVHFEALIEFKTTSPLPLKVRWTPSAYIHVIDSGCARVDGWVDLELEAVANAGVVVPDDEDTGW